LLRQKPHEKGLLAVNETVFLFLMASKRAVQVEFRPDLTSSDSSALLLRQVIEDGNVSAPLEQAQGAQGVHVCGVLRRVEADCHVGR
jgi:hypothetical protein